MSNIGVLELQGNYDLHHKIFSDLGISSKGIKTAKDLDNIEWASNTWRRVYYDFFVIRFI